MSCTHESLKYLGHLPQIVLSVLATGLIESLRISFKGLYHFVLSMT